jgi:hypothetical protein
MERAVSVQVVCILSVKLAIVGLHCLGQNAKETVHKSTTTAHLIIAAKHAILAAGYAPAILYQAV